MAKTLWQVYIVVNSLVGWDGRLGYRHSSVVGCSLLELLGRISADTFDAG